MAKPGRPSRLTEETERRIVQALQGGNFRNVAAGFAGVAYSTLRDWLREGKRRPRSRFGEFRRRVLEAERRAEMLMVSRVMAAAAADARHAQWFLERKFNARWGRKDQHVLAGEPKRPLVVDRPQGVQHGPLDVREFLAVADVLREVSDRGGLGEADAEAQPVHSAPADPTPDGVPPASSS